MWRSLFGFTAKRALKKGRFQAFLSYSLIVLAVGGLLWFIWRPQRVVIDRDHDGHWDETFYLRYLVVVKKAMDANKDGKADLWVLYRGGKPKELRHDSNFDGKVDLWGFYEENEISRVKTDLNFDGRLDYEGPYRLRKKRHSGEKTDAEKTGSRF